MCFPLLTINRMMVPTVVHSFASWKVGVLNGKYYLVVSVNIESVKLAYLRLQAKVVS